MKNFVFTEQSLNLFANLLTDEMLNTGSFKSPQEYINISFKNYEAFITYSAKDQHLDKLPFIIFQNENIKFEEYSKDEVSTILLETYRVVIQLFQTKGTSVYSPSIVYRKNNKIVLNILNDLHLFISVNFCQSQNIVVYRLTSDKSEEIESFSPNIEQFYEIENNKKEIIEEYKEQIETRALLEIDDTYNFSFTYANKEEANYTYDQWIRILSKKQKAFLENTSKKAMRLKGPAGTGKTLVMQLKAIKILRENKNARGLFTCHSWPVAFQVSDFFDRVASDITDRLEIWPLFSLAQEALGTGLGDMKILGEDSFSGKKEQIKILDSIVVNFLENEWKILKIKCSENFKNRIEAINQGNKNFLWDLLIEISCVIGANGIIPGRNKFEKYDKIERRPWMLPLEKSEDRNIVFMLYTNFMKYLESQNMMTSDQVINDYVKSLSGYKWNIERKKKGFNYVFVDEMQLFNDQERMALQFLSNNPDEYPCIYMAMDPKQAVENVYGDVGITDIIQKINPEIEHDMGISDFNLDIAYRYSQEILDFLKHVDSFYPTMGFRDLWNNKIQGTTSNKKKTGDTVDIFMRNSIEKCIIDALKMAEDYLQKGKQVAILTLSDDYYSRLMKNSNPYLKLINAMHETTVLAYTKKKIVVSKPSYIIGLQFDFVIILGCEYEISEDTPGYVYYERQFLADLYLGASRAKNKLVLINNTEASSFPNVLEKAIEKGYLIEKK